MNLREKVVSILRRKTKEDIKQEKTEENSVTLDDLMNYISNRIVGQEDAIKTLISNIVYNQVLIDEVEQSENVDLTVLESRKISMLLDGPAGTGKSAIINDIASKVSIPVSVTNIAKFFENGFTANDILYDLLVKADGDLQLAERGIIVIDEIEKIANNSDYSTIEARKSIQEEIIELMNGEIYDFGISQGDSNVNISFDTSKLTFVMSGNLSKQKSKKLTGEGQVRITGFVNNDKGEENTTIKGYINSGIIPNFFEKIKVVATTKNYEVEDYKNILLHSEISPLGNLVKTIKKFDYENVKCDAGLISKLATDAYELGVGARGLQILVSEAQNKVLFDIMTQKYNKSEVINLTQDLLEPGRQRVRK